MYASKADLRIELPVHQRDGLAAEGSLDRRQLDKHYDREQKQHKQLQHAGKYFPNLF